MKFKNIIFLFRKESKGLFRDRRTLITLIFLPLFCYPTLISGMNYFQKNAAVNLENYVPKIAIVDNSDGEIIKAIEGNNSFKIVVDSNFDENLINGYIQGIMKINGNTNSTYEVIFMFDSTDSKSRKSFEMINDFINKYKTVLVNKRLSSLGVDKSIIEPISVTGRDMASNEKLEGVAFNIIPYFMIISILAGAITSGVDLTAGEKERGTIATLLSCQLSNHEIVIGKVTVISMAGIISSILSVVGLFISLKINNGSAVQISTLPINSILMILSILIPISILISSIIVIMGLYARSVKEGNAYATPLYMVIIFLGVLTTIDGFNLNKRSFYVPILNSVFTLKSILSFQLDMQLYLTTITTTLIYSFASIYISIKLCEREEVLFRT